MRYIHIPSADLKLSVLCLGAGCFGGVAPRDEAWRMMDTYAEHGGNLLDTAHNYASGLPNGEGASELTIGGWMESRGNRKSVIVGTKGCTLDVETRNPPAFSPSFLAEEFGESLDRLRTDYVDIYWLHRDNPAVPVGEILGLFQEYITSGRIRALGASNWRIDRLQAAAEYAQAHGLTGFCASQIGWSLADMSVAAQVDTTAVYMDAAILDYHNRTKFPIVAFSSQAQGFFAGKGDSRDTNSVAAMHFTEENFKRLERGKVLAAKHGVSPNHIALAYITSHPFPSSAIIGPREHAQLVDSLNAGDLVLSADEVSYLDCGQD